MLESYRADLQHEIKRRENIEEEVRQSLASCTAAVDEAIRTALISTWKEGCMEPPPQPRSPSPGIRQQVVFSVIHSPPRDPCGNTQRINTRRRQLCGVLSPACDPPACPAETNGGSVSLYV
uniref:Uncharacterized protein n=1 Tax=Trypanosoma congolense (strain IL3000) TaxID=1068625 RepID=G0UZ25_TRYCI|nr:hypothetical protein, unlikely [Trypanosoma congolense IL3000]